MVADRVFEAPWSVPGAPTDRDIHVSAISEWACGRACSGVTDVVLARTRLYSGLTSYSSSPGASVSA